MPRGLGVWWESSSSAGDATFSLCDHIVFPQCSCGERERLGQRRWGGATERKKDRELAGGEGIQRERGRDRSRVKDRLRQIRDRDIYRQIERKRERE